MKPGERWERLARARLYLVTDAGRTDLPDFLDDVLGAGVDVVQIREKDAEAAEVIHRAEPFRAAAERHGALFLVNDRPDVAFALDADGVHLGQEDVPVPLARELLGPDVLIGLSTHSPGQLDAAPEEADYVSAGPVWETPTKAGRPAVGLEVVRHAAATQSRPWFAIGGIDPATLPEVIAAGARRVVVVRAITGAADPPAMVRRLLHGLPL
jgi:thiamine-phosphate pyrophosphorylase